MVFVDLPTSTKSEDHAPVGKMIESGRTVRKQRGMMHRGGCHERADTDLRSHRRDCRKDRPRFVGVAFGQISTAGVHHVVVGEPEAEPAEVIGEPSKIEDLVDGASRGRPNREAHTQTVACRDHNSRSL